VTILQRVRRQVAVLGQFRKAMDAQAKAEARLRQHLDAGLRALPPVPASGRNLVMGLTVGCGPAELAPFVDFLRGTGSTADDSVGSLKLSAA
jgi:hypothetical protein